MNRSEIRAQLLELLATVAPDIEPSTIDSARNLRDQFDFDSMDALHLATAVSETFGIDIAETEYTELASLEAAERFIERRLATPHGN